MTVEAERIKELNERPKRTGNYILYWMQASQRARNNPALEYAIIMANRSSKPLVVFFGLTPSFPEANLRHYHFMLQGISEVSSELENRGIKFVLRAVSPEKGAQKMSKEAQMVVTDRGYLRIQRIWRKALVERVKCKVVQVEGDVVVPIESVSQKEEFSARTIRKKINDKLGNYLRTRKSQTLKSRSLNMKFDSLDPGDIDGILKALNIDRSVGRSEEYRGGYSHAKKNLDIFVKKRLEDFEEKRNHPGLEVSSDLSPYLHFGQISPVEIANAVRKGKGPGSDAFLEELIVRRELSMNFVYYNPDYDNFNCLNQWARDTLSKHKMDKREYIYDLDELENGKTHDPYWNAAQKEMNKTGKMHGYMRMYWGKKILEWTEDPKIAHERALYLNNRYELDGRDPNGFTGVAWCFGKHDRPWVERPIFGKVRYMNDRGLERKFDMKIYTRKFGL